MIKLFIVYIFYFGVDILDPNMSKFDMQESDKSMPVKVNILDPNMSKFDMQENVTSVKSTNTINNTSSLFPPLGFVPFNPVVNKSPIFKRKGEFNLNMDDTQYKYVYSMQELGGLPLCSPG